MNHWRLDTQLIHASQSPHPVTGAVSQPIVPAVAYAFPSAEAAAAVVAGEQEGFYYGRYGNPTIQVLEQKLALLEGAEDALAVSSGMAAISIALMSCLAQGDHVVVTKDVYGGTYSFLSSFAARYGISYTFVDCTDSVAVERAIAANPRTKALYMETPSNPRLTVLDIGSLSAVARASGVKVIVDNTFMTPCLQQPLRHGAHITVHSATKYINGHGDVIAGIIAASKQDIAYMRKKLMGDLGQNLNAWEAFLILRGLKTMSLRVERHCRSALTVAQFLENHPAIADVYYPGLPSHPQHQLAARQMKAMGGIVSFELKGGLDAGKAFINALRLALISFSLGDPETLVQHPASMTHAAIPPEERRAMGIADGLIRLSVGLEDAHDIIDDLQLGLQAAMSRNAQVAQQAGQQAE